MVRSTTWPAVRLASEFVGVFVGIPVFIALRLVPVSPIPLLCAIALVAVCVLRRLGPGAEMLSAIPRPAVRTVLLQTALAGLALLGVACLAPGAHLFGFVRRSPQNWAVLMVVYPLLSALPQEILFRVFLFRRYDRLFPSPVAQAVASSAAFAFAHIIFAGVLTIVLSLAGGLLFSHTYARSRSLWLVSLQHAVLGDIIFTTGLGAWFTYAPR